MAKTKTELARACDKIDLLREQQDALIETLAKWRGGACGCTDEVRCQMCRDFDAVLAQVGR